MDLLSQYKQQKPAAFHEPKPQQMADEYGREYTGMVGWVVRLSGGTIHTAQQASYALLTVAIIVALTSFMLFAKQWGFFQSSPEQVYYPTSVINTR